VSSNEKLIRQFIRESLIAERKDRGDVRRAGQSVGVGTMPDVIGWIGSVKKIIGHAIGVVSSLAYAGVAAYKGAESVFKIGAEGMKGLLGGGTPDYESIVTNQATTLRKARGFLGRTQQRPGILQTTGLATESIHYSLDTFSLENMSLDFLLEADEARAGEEAEADKIVDDAIEAAAEEEEEAQETILATPLEDEPLVDLEPIDQSQIDPEVVEVDPEIDDLQEPDDGLGELPDPAQEVLPQIDVSQVPEVVSELSNSARLDMDNLLVMYRDAMSSQDLNSLAISLSSLMGKPGESGSFTPQVLAQRVKKITGENVTVEDIQAGSEDLFSQIRVLIPDIFSGVIGGSLDRIVSETSSDSPEVQEAILVAIKPIYEETLQQIRPLEAEPAL